MPLFARRRFCAPQSNVTKAVGPRTLGLAFEERRTFGQRSERVAVCGAGKVCARSSVLEVAAMERSVFPQRVRRGTWKAVLVVKPVLEQCCVFRTVTFNVRNPVHRNPIRHHRIYPAIACTERGTHPLLFPFTLCSENVMSLWSILTPRLCATCRRSSSVVHCKKYRREAHTSGRLRCTAYMAREKHRVQTHCRSPMYSASCWPLPAGLPPAPAAPFIWPPLYAPPFCPDGAGVGEDSDLSTLPFWPSRCCSESSSSLRRFSPTTGECAGASEVFFSSICSE